MDDRARQRDYFEAVEYERPDSPAQRSYIESKLEHVERYLPLTSDLSVLDLACANGSFSTYLVQRVRRVIGLDFSAKLLRENPIECRVQADATNLPFGSASFDVVFEANLLHHLDPAAQVQAMREMSRVSRRHVVLIEPNVLNPLMVAYALYEPVERGLLRFTPRYLKGLIHGAGLRLVARVSTGMITQNKTPEFMIPFLENFDGRFPFGVVQVAVAAK